MKPFEIIDKFGRKIKLTTERAWHIAKRPEILEEEELIKSTLISPEEVRESKDDRFVWLFYKTNPKAGKWNKYILVIVKILNGEGFIVTSFFTGFVKEGRVIWKKN